MCLKLKNDKKNWEKCGKNGGRASLSNLRPKLVYKKILKKQTACQVPIYGK